jgi:5-methylcytosine-specific restriction endonuclease McrA
MSRPSLPEELRRQIAVESGHRCAIPTCRNPDFDVHHIVPWKKCRKHEADNLIALCPNCHRRAHRGEIDRKSLLQYKQQLNPKIKASDIESNIDFVKIFEDALKDTVIDGGEF